VSRQPILSRENSNEERLIGRLEDALLALAKVSLVFCCDGATEDELLDVDDYIQTILIGESLIANRGVNHRDLVRRYRTKPGHIIAGREVAASGISSSYKGQLKKLIDSRDVAFRATDGITGGSAMKVACIAAFFVADVENLVRNTDAITTITHNSTDARLAALLVVLRFRQIFLEKDPSTDYLRSTLIRAIGQLDIAGSDFFVQMFDQGASRVNEPSSPARLLAELNDVVGLSHVATSVPISACLWSFRALDMSTMLATWDLHNKREIRAGDVTIEHRNWQYQAHRRHFLDLGYTERDSRLLKEESYSHFDLDTFFSIAFSLQAAQHGVDDGIREGELDELTDNLHMLSRNLIELSQCSADWQ
jgi:hypothetical protein